MVIDIHITFWIFDVYSRNKLSSERKLYHVNGWFRRQPACTCLLFRILFELVFGNTGYDSFFGRNESYTNGKRSSEQDCTPVYRFRKSQPNRVHLHQTVAGSFNLTDFASKSALDSVT